jgi:hypothetical protein
MYIYTKDGQRKRIEDEQEGFNHGVNQRHSQSVHPASIEGFTDKQKKWMKWVLLALILIALVVGGYMYWKKHSKKEGYAKAGFGCGMGMTDKKKFGFTFY